MVIAKNIYLVGWLVLGIAITVGSLIPIEAVPQSVSLLSDKIQHGVAYFCLGALGWQAATSRAALIIFVSISLGLGVAIEFLQPLSGRHFEWADMAANSTGLIIAIILFGSIEYRNTHKSRIKL
ncbi:hypothetical protein A9Q83_06115 [Alphaproteobacteria bacterium 46_93_T64]|nr:hypothetical protein A9Q83_06115 [Alphaproteobacteria bacterium 46_93_T64]